MTDTTFVRRQIPEFRALPLGRHVEHDPRSLSFVHEPVRKVTLKKIDHARVGDWFDQGSVGSCTGEAITATCNVRPLFKTGQPKRTQTDAYACYGLATKLDGFPGIWPPDDTGSSGLAACKAAKQLGWITKYSWAFGIDQLLAALMGGGVCVGVPWYEGFDHPSATGLVQIAGNVRGGHEFLIRGYDPTAGLQPSQALVKCDNSWTVGWGLRGRFTMTVDTLDQLLHQQGDCVVPGR